MPRRHLSSLPPARLSTCGLSLGLGVACALSLCLASTPLALAGSQTPRPSLTPPSAAFQGSRSSLVAPVAVLPSGNPLHDAIVLGRTTEALALLASASTREADLQRRFPQGWTLLHLAAYHGDASLVLALLARGLRPDVRDDLGNTPLHTAARFDRVGALVLLAMKGGPLDAANASGKTPLRLAIENDCHLAVRALLRLGARQPGVESPERPTVSLRPAAILLRSRRGVQPVPDPRPERLWQRWQDDFRLFGTDRDRIRRVLSNPRLDAETQLTIIQAILRQRGIDPDRP